MSMLCSQRKYFLVKKEIKKCDFLLEGGCHYGLRKYSSFCGIRKGFEETRLTPFCRLYVLICVFVWLFCEFRDRFAREKRNLESTVLSLQSSLELTQERMNKEEELKDTTQAAQKQLMGEKRELLAK